MLLGRECRSRRWSPRRFTYLERVRPGCRFRSQVRDDSPVDVTIRRGVRAIFMPGGGGEATHNPKVASSNLAPATTKPPRFQYLGGFGFLAGSVEHPRYRVAFFAYRVFRRQRRFGVGRAASSAFAGQPKSRATSAISASATTHLARATAPFGPKAREARRRRAFARTRSPRCAIAMPRGARAGASSRRATRFNAPRGSPAASARAAAVISESIGIPSHL